MEQKEERKKENLDLAAIWVIASIAIMFCVIEGSPILQMFGLVNAVCAGRTYYKLSKI